MKQQKLFFFLTLTIYMAIMVIVNTTVRRDDVVKLMNKSNDLTDSQLVAAIIVGTIITLFILVVLLVLIRLLLQLFFKFFYKEAEKATLNEMYFTPLIFKFTLMIALQILLIAGFVMSKLWINIAVIVCYTLYVFFFSRLRETSDRQGKRKGIQLATGILLILAI